MTIDPSHMVGVALFSSAMSFFFGWLAGWHRANGLWREAMAALPKQTLYPDRETAWQPDLPSERRPAPSDDGNMD